MELRSVTKWRQGIEGEAITSCPSLKDGRISCGGPEDRLLEAKGGGQGTVLIGKEQCGRWTVMDRRGKETSFPTLLTVVAAHWVKPLTCEKERPCHPHP